MLCYWEVTMIIDYNRLKTFITVAREGSITLAAAKLHLTQQAVSSQILLLEEGLGLLLFKRANRKIYLTKEGNKIFTSVTQNFMAMENEISALVGGMASLEGTISIGATNEVAEILLAPVLADFNKANPNIKFELVLGDDASSEAAILNGKLDLACVVFSKEIKLLSIQPFKKEVFITVASKAFLKKSNVDIKRLDDLLDQPIIDFQADCPSLKAWVNKNDKKLLAHFDNKTATFAANDDRMIRKLVLLDLGIANLPKSLFQDELAKGSVVEILPDSKKIKAGLDIIAMKRKTESLAIQNFKQFLLAAP